MIKKQVGMSLLEVLIAVSLLVIISTGITSVMSNTAKQQRSIQAKDNQRDVSAKIRSVLSNRTGCMNTFGSKAVDATITDIKDSVGNSVFAVGSTDSSGLIKVESMKLENWVELNSTFKIGSANFKVVLSKVGDVLGSRTLNPDNINIQIKTDAASTIVDCIYAGQLGNENLWSKDAGGTNIYYEIGNVAIGHADPKAKLDVQGEIKVGNTNTACSVDTEGTQRYSSASKAMEFCDGIAWKKIAIDSTAPPAAVNCVGSWSVCSGGQKTYTILIPAENGGTACPNSNGETSTSGCPAWLGVTGSCYSATGCGTGTRTTSYICSLSSVTYPDSSCLPPKPAATSASCSLGICIRSCFTGETLVKMKNKLQKIKDIQLGDIVVGKDNKLNKVVYKYQNETEQSFFGINGGKEFITGQHPILSKNREWLVFDLESVARYPWQDQTLVLRQAQVGDILYDGTVIRSISRKNIKTIKYNIGTDGNMMFYANGVLAHSVAFSYKGETEGNSPHYRYEFINQGHILKFNNAEKNSLKDGNIISHDEFMNFLGKFNQSVGLNILKLNNEIKNEKHKK